MEAVFRRFEAFDFESDPRFQVGLEVLRSGSSSGDEPLDVKVFFYNRFVEPIDGSSYRRWRSSPPEGTQTDGSLEQLEQRTPSDMGENQTRLSFADVMRLVQEGKEVPGARNLDIKPSNQSPTPSQMERTPKPWETKTKPPNDI